VDYKTTVTDVFTRNEKVKTLSITPKWQNYFWERQRVWTEDRI